MWGVIWVKLVKNSWLFGSIEGLETKRKTFTKNFIDEERRNGDIDMDRRKLQIIAKIGLLVVLIGFLMPITCDLNGFEIAGELLDMGGNGGIVFLLFILFGSALIGGILLLLQKHSLGIDWTVFIICVGSGLITYSSLNKMAGKLQGGGYLIILGWIVAGISLVVATIKFKEDQEANSDESSSNSNQFQFLNSEASRKMTTTDQKQTIGHMPDNRIEGERIGTFDFSKTVAMDWPVELESGYLMKDSQSKDPEMLTGYIKVRNVQSRDIQYMEWQLTCYDILNKPIYTDTPVIIRHEEHNSAKQTVTASTTGNLPSGTRSFIPYLKAVLYGDKEIEEFSDGIEKTSVNPKTELKHINGYNAKGLIAYYEKHGLEKTPVYTYEKNDGGIWTCAFCGTRNKKDATECRLCSVETSQQELCSREAIEQSFEDWKLYLEQKEEEHHKKWKEEEKNRLEEKQRHIEEAERKAQEERKLHEFKKKRTKARLKKLAIIALVLVVVGGIGLPIYIAVDKSQRYNEAKSMMASGENYRAYLRFRNLGNYKDAREKIEELSKIKATFDLQGGVTANGESIIVVPFYSADRPPAPRPWAGYVFDGWWTEPQGDGELFTYKSLFSLFTTSQGHVLYAKWLYPHTVSFDSTGGIAVEPIANVVHGTKVAAPASPTKGISVFDGWYKESGCVNRWEFAVDVVAADTTLYAKWDLYSIGDTGPAGGIVFYRGSFGNGWHYLEAAPASTEWRSKEWGGYGTNVGGTSTKIGSGKSNTAKIIAKYGNAEPYDKKTDYAAKLCADLTYGGFSDWFLPSKDDLDLMFKNLYKKNIGGFDAYYYWSSSEYSSYGAWRQYFSDGSQYSYDKYTNLRVRAVRAF